MMNQTYHYTPEQLKAHSEKMRTWVTDFDQGGKLPQMFIAAADALDRLLAGKGSYDEVNQHLEELDAFMHGECDRLESQLSEFQLSHLHEAGGVQ